MNARRRQGRRTNQRRSHVTRCASATLVALGVLSAAPGLPRLAHADRNEARWSARPLGGVALMQEGGADPALAPTAGASIAMAYGLSHQLDLGLEVMSMMIVPTFDGAILVDGYVARGDFKRRTSSALVLAGPTWRFGSPDRWTPVIAASAGGGLRYRSIGVFSDIELQPPGKTAGRTMDYAASAKVGLERRINRRLTFGAYFSTLATWSEEAPTFAVASVSFGLSYVHYPLLW
jgi:hypothetical protein